MLEIKRKRISCRHPAVFWGIMTMLGIIFKLSPSPIPIIIIASKRDIGEHGGRKLCSLNPEDTMKERYKKVTNFFDK